MKQALAAYRRGNDAGLGYAPYTNEPGDGTTAAAVKAARVDGWEVVLAPVNTSEVVVLRNADGELMAIGGDGVGGSVWAVDITDEVQS